MQNILFVGIDGWSARADNWTVVAFHTAAADDLVEELASIQGIESRDSPGGPYQAFGPLVRTLIEIE